ncbi:MAG TPA: hypothetical protein VHR40_12455 [Thermoleophilaceae bacterium]|nr:hypothetical protein [Thermoleophilaceae bacterium]
MTRLLALGAVVLAAGFGATAEAAARPAHFTPGVVASADHVRSARAAGLLGARVVRVEFDIGTPASALRRTVGAIAKRGATPLLLAGFYRRLPTDAEARNVASWAAMFGPGARFWRHRRHRHPVRLIEFGNETSYVDQYGDSFDAPSYAARAETYASRFAQAHAAIHRTHRKVGLLAQGDDGGTGSRAWVDHMFQAVPRLAHMVAGWTVHPYGPRWRWESKMHSVVRQTAAHGASRRIPIDVTEYGVSSDNGAWLTDNYGWPSDETYSEAAADLRRTVAEMRSDRMLRRRLRLFLVYAAYDLRPPLVSNDREHYFGALRHNLTRKGAYTAEVRRLMSP